VNIADYVAGWAASPFGHLADPPWAVTARAEALVRAALEGLGAGFRRDGEAAVHATATVEPGAVLKGPIVIGPACLVAAGAYLRGGVWMGQGAVVGPACELKSSLLFPGAKLAHFNFVGDSILGAGVNLEAGAIIANHRNERADKVIRIAVQGRVIETGVEKFGALIGDGARLGANAVIAPGALLAPGTVVPRLGLVDLSPD
jgi:NDP-sugar pyrophosphorylase family protein